jgi:hypothetical protein
MAFELAHPKLELEKLSPARRAAAALIGLLVLLGVALACVTAYHAQPLDAPAPRAGAQHAG